MSRFFRSTSDSESDSETSSSENESLYSQSDSEYDSSDAESYHSDNDQQEQQPRNRFLRGGSDSEDSEDEANQKRQAKSQKDKRLEEMENAVKAIENGQKNSDWNLMATEFDKLTITVNRATTGFNAIPMPKFYIKIMVELEDFLAESLQKDKSNKKKSGNTKAMNNLKQKLRKLSKQYEEPIAAYRKDPEEFMKEEEVVEEPVKPTKKEVASQDKAVAAADDDEGFSSVGKGGKVTASVTPQNLLLRLREILESRGKKNTDRSEQISTLESLLGSATSPFQKISVLLALLASRFDITGVKAPYMELDVWKSSAKEVNSLLEVLENNKSFLVVEDAEDLDNEDKDITPKEGEVIKIRGSILSFVERLDDEFTKSLQHIDPHAPDYIERLKDEAAVYAMLDRAQVYCETNNINFALPRIIARKLDHVYYKPEQLVASLQVASKKLVPKYVVSKITESEDGTNTVNQLCNLLYKEDSTVFRTRAMLCHIYYYALHKKFHTARDLLLMSHVQDSIHQADISTQILYNRAMVQIGICAFRDGFIKEAHAALSEIQGTGRVKELLAQGVQAQRQTGNAEVDAAERQRQLPFHMHINLELLECIFLTCSMLLEIPAQAQAGPNGGKKFISKPFRRLLDYNERQAFIGPPENTRDHIMSAAKALASGEWEKARDFILAIKVWDLMTETKEIKEMLVRKIQEEGLRTYLFTYCSYYATLGLDQLSTMFDLPASTVSAIVSKMIFNEELSASLDQVNQCIVLHQVELSRLQTLALQYSEKVANLVDQNERAAHINGDGNTNNNNNRNTNYTQHQHAYAQHVRS